MQLDTEISPIANNSGVQPLLIDFDNKISVKIKDNDTLNAINEPAVATFTDKMFALNNDLQREGAMTLKNNPDILLAQTNAFYVGESNLQPGETQNIDIKMLPKPDAEKSNEGG